MKRIQKQWLASAPWETVLSINHALCQDQKTEHKPSPAHFSARQAWEAAVPKQMTLPEALEICKKACDSAPFVFNNGNTFAAIGKTLIEDWLRNIPPVEAQIIRTTVAHFVAGLVGKRELVSILDHFEPLLKAPSASAPSAAAPSASPAPKPAAPSPLPGIPTAQPGH